MKEIERKTAEISRRKTQCDTTFRQKHKQLLEKHFHIQEYGEQIVVVRQREGGLVLARKIQGLYLGTGARA